MPQTEAWTVGRLLTWTTDYLKRHGSDTPRLDAELLLAESAGCDRIDLYAGFDALPDEAVRTAFRDLVRRRAEGTPVAYLLGRREFYSLSFRVTPDVLIPRPETEFLVIALLDLARGRPDAQPITVCDVGTGSGNIAVCVAKHLPQCRVLALDIHPGALEVAGANVAGHAVQGRVELLRSDLFAAVPPERRFDFVVSNPPYVGRSEWESLAPDVRRFEPTEALVGGAHGTETIQRLVPQAAEHLGPGGHLLIEISPTHHEEVQGLLVSDDRFRLGSTIKDLKRLPRVVHATRI
ncbi:MAG: peptide chain release factor N(5)-glutamine methyltransferase [Planctomycetota bacterium]|jgi:release factor glutamine methyltransferase